MWFAISIIVLLLLIVRWFISLSTSSPPREESDEQVEARIEEELKLKRLHRELEKKELRLLDNPEGFEPDDDKLPF